MCGHRPSDRYGRRPVVWSTHRSSQVVSEIRYITYIFPTGSSCVHNISLSPASYHVQGALTFRRGRTSVSRSWSWSVSGLGRDAPSGIWATRRPLDLGHGGICRAEVSDMSVGRSVCRDGWVWTPWEKLVTRGMCSVTFVSARECGLVVFLVIVSVREYSGLFGFWPEFGSVQ